MEPVPTDTASTRQTFLATVTPTAFHRRVAWWAAVLSVVSLFALAPFADVPMVRLGAFIASYEAALTLIDLVTAFLLLSQFAILRRRSLLIVSCAYGLSSVLVAAHAFSFPPVGRSVGLYGDAQTTIWLYVFWHTAFPLLIACYAWIADSTNERLPERVRTGRAIGMAIGVVGVVAAGLIALATLGGEVLPPLVVAGSYHRMIDSGVSPAILVVCGVAIALMWRRRHRSVMDVWLFAALWVWLCDVALSAVVSSSRYDLGWYAGRVYGLLGASFVLVALLFELAHLYVRLADAMTEADARNAELVRSRDLLARAQRFEALGQVTGGIAHDFNNLLTAITGGLEMIARRPEDRDRVVRLANNATKAADRGSQLIRRLMSFARKQNLRPEVLDANETLREFTVLVANLPVSRATIALDFSDVGTICVDESEFQAAFLNLVGNARDAMPDGGRIVVSTRRVTLTAADVVDSEARPGDYVRVSVTDTGTGMSPEVQARVFEPFFTTKAHGLGTGLGLSQVYGFARSAAGQAVVESHPGRGTTIRLDLPRSTAPRDRPRAAAPLAARATSGRSVLLVDDDGDVLVATKDRVEELGYDVVTATSGDEAMRLIEGGLNVDIVLSDIVMPGRLNGVQLAEAVRRVRPAQSLVLTSGYTGSALEQFHLPQGLLFLPKPYSQQELADKLVAATAS